MKKKFLILTLCFTLIFSSLSYKKSYADGGVISLPILATVSALAVGTGIVINNSDDLYDVGKLFFDYVDRHNDLTWSTVQSLFLSSVSALPNNLVSVDSKFLDIVKDFFDNTFLNFSTSDFDSVYSYVESLPLYPSFIPLYKGTNIFGNIRFEIGDNLTTVYYNDVSFGAFGVMGVRAYIEPYNSNYGYITFEDAYSRKHVIKREGFYIGNSISFPYNGGYTWDNVESKKENDKVALPIPGDLGQLVGQGSTDFWSNTDSLVGNGSLSIPTVSNPSISVDTTIDSFVGSNDTDVPGVPDVGNPVLPSLPSWGSGLDFSPITEVVFTDKFPFCLAKDVSDIISVFDIPAKEPIFKVPFLGDEVVLDMTEFKLLFDIVKFFVLIGFIISLIVLTRGIIG